MKIEQIANPSQPQVNGAKAEITGGAMSARERALAKLMTPPQQTGQPIPNATQVTPEEMGAIAPKTTRAVDQGQNYRDESVVEEQPSVEPKAEPKASEEPISSQYAILARKEKLLRQREQQLKAREAALSKPVEPPKPAEPAFDPSKYVDKTRLTSDPFTVLNELGLTYDQLTEMAMKAPSAENLQLMNELRSLKSEIESLRGESKKAFEEKEAADRQHALNLMAADAKRLIRTDPNFEMIRAERAEREVVSLIEKTFDEDGILMSVEEAAQQVEDYLVEKAIRIAKAKKIQQRLAPSKPAQPVQKEPQPQDPAKQQLKTLTNSVASTRPLSARERALLAFEGKLRK